MRFAIRHVISLLESPLADTKFLLRSQPKETKSCRLPQSHLEITWEHKGVSNSAWHPPSAYYLTLGPDQLSPTLLQDALHGTRSSLTTSSQTEPADKAHMLSFNLIHHTKSCSSVAGAQTQEVWVGVHICYGLCMKLGKTVEPSVSWLPVSCANTIACSHIHSLSGISAV